jgi:hypothetical protein
VLRDSLQLQHLRESQVFARRSDKGGAQHTGTDAVIVDGRTDDDAGAGASACSCRTHHLTQPFTPAILKVYVILCSFFAQPLYLHFNVICSFLWHAHARHCLACTYGRTAFSSARLCTRSKFLSSDDNPDMRLERPLNPNRILMHAYLIPDDDAEMRLERLDLDIETIADGIQSTQDEIEFRESKIAGAARRVPRAGERRVSAAVDALAGVHSDGECVVRRVRAVRDGVGDVGARERVSE